jgi:hypothetical protein
MLSAFLPAFVRFKRKSKASRPTKASFGEIRLSGASFRRKTHFWSLPFQAIVAGGFNFLGVFKIHDQTLDGQSQGLNCFSEVFCYL